MSLLARSYYRLQEYLRVISPQRPLGLVGSTGRLVAWSCVAGCLLVVTHTSAETLRGSLLRTLLFGAPLKLTWAREIRIVLGILITFGLVEFLILNAQYSFSMGSILTACFSIVGMINPLLSIAVARWMLFRILHGPTLLDSRWSTCCCLETTIQQVWTVPAHW